MPPFFQQTPRPLPACLDAAAGCLGPQPPRPCPAARPRGPAESGPLRARRPLSLLPRSPPCPVPRARLPFHPLCNTSRSRLRPFEARALLSSAVFDIMDLALTLLLYRRVRRSPSTHRRRQLFPRGWRAVVPRGRSQGAPTLQGNRAHASDYKKYSPIHIPVIMFFVPPRLVDISSPAEARFLGRSAGGGRAGARAGACAGGRVDGWAGGRCEKAWG